MTAQTWLPARPTDDADRPIIIFGAARSGTSLLHRLFTLHEQTAWLTRLCDLYPDRPALNRFHLQLVDRPLIGPWLRRRLVPGECYPFWEHHSPGFSRPFRDLTEADLLPHTQQRLPLLLRQMTTARRSRPVLKVTGWPRVGWLRGIWPRARFVHIVRDGRAVLSSTLQVGFWMGWQGPHNWRFGPLPERYQALWEAHDRSFVALAGIGWNLVQDATLALPNAADVFTIRYENLCADPVAVLQQTADFCDLPWTPGFARAVAAYPVRTTDNRWREELTPPQQAIADAVTAEHRCRLDYV